MRTKQNERTNEGRSLSTQYHSRAELYTERSDIAAAVCQLRSLLGVTVNTAKKRR